MNEAPRLADHARQEIVRLKRRMIVTLVGMGAALFLAGMAFAQLMGLK